MKNLKQILFGTAVALSTLTLVFTSCNKDECEDVTCYNGGYCNSGVCICEAGYEGNTCETTSISKFTKNWDATDVKTGSTTNLNYSTLISQKLTNNIFQVTISDISDGYFVNNVEGAVEGNVIVIPNYEPDNDGYSIEGTITYNSDGTLSAAYSITDTNNVVLNYTGTWK